LNEEYIRNWRQLHSAEDLNYCFLLGHQANLFMLLGRPSDAIHTLEEVVPALQQRMLRPDQSTALMYESLLGRAHEQQGQIGKATEIFMSLPRRAAAALPERRARDICYRSARFLAGTRHYDEAAAALELLRASFDASPVEAPHHFGWVITAIAG